MSFLFFCCFFSVLEGDMHGGRLWLLRRLSSTSRARTQSPYPSPIPFRPSLATAKEVLSLLPPMPSTAAKERSGRRKKAQKNPSSPPPLFSSPSSSPSLSASPSPSPSLTPSPSPTLSLPVVDVVAKEEEQSEVKPLESPDSVARLGTKAMASCWYPPLATAEELKALLLKASSPSPSSFPRQRQPAMEVLPPQPSLESPSDLAMAEGCRSLHSNANPNTISDGLKGSFPRPQRRKPQGGKQKDQQPGSLEAVSKDSAIELSPTEKPQSPLLCTTAMPEQQQSSIEMLLPPTPSTAPKEPPRRRKTVQKNPSSPSPLFSSPSPSQSLSASPSPFLTPSLSPSLSLSLPVLDVVTKEEERSELKPLESPDSVARRGTKTNASSWYPPLATAEELKDLLLKASSPSPSSFPRQRQPVTEFLPPQSSLESPSDSGMVEGCRPLHSNANPHTTSDGLKGSFPQPRRRKPQGGKQKDQQPGSLEAVSKDSAIELSPTEKPRSPFLCTTSMPEQQQASIEMLLPPTPSTAAKEPCRRKKAQKNPSSLPRLFSSPSPSLSLSASPSPYLSPSPSLSLPVVDVVSKEEDRSEAKPLESLDSVSCRGTKAMASCWYPPLATAEELKALLLKASSPSPSYPRQQQLVTKFLAPQPSLESPDSAMAEGCRPLHLNANPHTTSDGLEGSFPRPRQRKPQGGKQKDQQPGSLEAVPKDSAIELSPTEKPQSPLLCTTPMPEQQQSHIEMLLPPTPSTTAKEPSRRRKKEQKNPSSPPLLFSSPSPSLSLSASPSPSPFLIPSLSPPPSLPLPVVDVVTKEEERSDVKPLESPDSVACRGTKAMASCWYPPLATAEELKALLLKASSPSPSYPRQQQLVREFLPPQPSLESPDSAMAEGCRSLHLNANPHTTSVGLKGSFPRPRQRKPQGGKQKDQQPGSLEAVPKDSAIELSPTEKPQSPLLCTTPMPEQQQSHIEMLLPPTPSTTAKEPSRRRKKVQKNPSSPSPLFSSPSPSLSLSASPSPSPFLIPSLSPSPSLCLPVVDVVTKEEERSEVKPLESPDSVACHGTKAMASCWYPPLATVEELKALLLKASSPSPSSFPRQQQPVTEFLHPQCSLESPSDSAMAEGCRPLNLNANPHTTSDGLKESFPRPRRRKPQGGKQKDQQSGYLEAVFKDSAIELSPM